MSGYVIATDSSADLIPDYAAEKGLLEMQLTFTLEGKTYKCDDPSLPRKDFYEKMRAGQMPITAQVNIEEANDKFIPVLEAGQDILCISFSSGLSGTCGAVRIAAADLEARYPGRRIVVIDSLCASAGQGLLVMRAAGYREQGLSLDDAASRVKDDIPHIAHYFTVDDLFHLRRGGRVSTATAVVGSMLGIKPVLHVDDNGKLVPIGKVRGRKQSLLALAEQMEEKYDRANCEYFTIAHGDCVGDAQFVADEISARLGIKKYFISMIDPTVGAHAGPGTVALFFYSKER